ncbi:helix-turn-helix transcriptional regulator [Gracilimonas sp.]|uniref:helix-turn-helix domain-containing protein n=1 Tax=Gracilimonas sp. TaxID=1974203 RepID=UPI0032EF666F
MSSNVDIQKFSAMVKDKRGGIGLRETAKKIGDVSPSTLSRIEKGKIPDLDTFVKICQWLDVSPDEFVPGFSGKSIEDQMQGKPTSELIAFHLRADQAMSPDLVEALITMVKAAEKQ